MWHGEGELYGVKYMMKMLGRGLATDWQDTQDSSERQAASHFWDALSWTHLPVDNRPFNHLPRTTVRLHALAEHCELDSMANQETVQPRET